MSAEQASSSDNDDRHAAFLTYAHKDNIEFVEDFANVFKDGILSKGGLDRKIFLDQWQDDKEGTVDEYLREHASRADYLIIFIGDHYPSRDFCLLEWTAFQSQFKEKETALKRLIIIEIDRDAVDRLGSEAPLSENAAAVERAADVMGVFRKSLVEEGRRVASRREDSKISQQFELRVKDIGKEFAEKYTKWPEQGKPPIPDRNEALSEGVDDESAEAIDVIIADSTPDLGTAVSKLEAELGEIGLRVGKIQQTESFYLDDKELASRLQKAAWLVQPFSSHLVGNADIAGGHLVRQARLFNRPGRTLFWRTDGALHKGVPPREVEKREEHRPIIDQLHAGDAPDDLAGCSVVLGSTDDVIRTLCLEDEADDADAPQEKSPRIVWEAEPEIEEKLSQARQLANTHYQQMSSQGTLHNFSLQLRQIIEEEPIWRTNAHGIVLTDYAKDEGQLYKQVNLIWDRLEEAKRKIPIIIFATDKNRLRENPEPKSILLDVNGRQPQLVESSDFEEFLNKACEVAQQEDQALSE